MIDDERHWDGVILGGGLLQVLGVVALYFLDRPSLAPVEIDLGWHTLALVQSVLLFSALMWVMVLEEEVRSIRMRLADLEPSERAGHGGVADD